MMEAADEGLLALVNSPKAHWSQLASANTLERRNKELKRRSREISIVPNDAAVVRLPGTLMAEQSDEWQVTRGFKAVGALRLGIHQKIQNELQLIPGERNVSARVTATPRFPSATPPDTCLRRTCGVPLASRGFECRTHVQGARSITGN